MALGVSRAIIWDFWGRSTGITQDDYIPQSPACEGRVKQETFGSTVF